MEYQNYFRLRSWVPWRRTYFIVDTEGYLADQLFIEKKIPVYFGREFIKKDSPYVVIEVKLQRKQESAFLEAMEKLKRLSEFDLHSIEQPICAGQWEEMARLAAESPLAIALDEELIGCNTLERKQELLSTIRPQYIVIKPSLHGGICGGDEWITEAEKQQIGWWITSALESNIGLNAIAQWCATFSNPLPQGLGTGALFTDNVEVPLEIRKDCLWFCK